MRITRAYGTWLWQRRLLATLALLIFPSRAQCYPTDIVFIENPSQLSPSRKDVEVASGFYGLHLDAISTGNLGSKHEIMVALRRPATLGAIISAGALPFLDKRDVFLALRRGPHRSAPLLVVDVAHETGPALLKAWSGGALVSCVGLISASSAEFWFTSEVQAVTRELSGQIIPITEEKVCGLTRDRSHPSAELIQVRKAGSDQPLLIRTNAGQQEVFFQGELQSPNTRYGRKNLVTIFPEIAPLMMFVRYCAGEHAWHPIAHYANLTIDDAWLTEPYGNLNYAGLLQEMGKVNFHTTIAFIPWNFDRSRPDVVSFFRSHPDRFSICIHGNNHDHQEFCEYKTKPLSIQVGAVRQAIARMERFKALTGIPYDRVMVWPHEVVPPEPTLRTLKEYNFLANVNADIVPLGSRMPDDALFVLRSESLFSATFLTIRRLPISLPFLESSIAINAFLGNPILFYSHQDLFADGINAFDGTAELVNHIQPETVWESLGQIVRRLYDVRLRDDGDYDVKAFSSEMYLDNVNSRDVTFFVKKPESSSVPIKSLTVDGRPHPYDRSDDEVSFKVKVPAKQSALVVIAYQNDLNVASIDVSKPSLRINTLRRLSDFRDMTVSKYALGRALIHAYNGRLSPIESLLEIHPVQASTLLITLLGLIAVRRGLRRRVRRNGVRLPIPPGRRV